MSATLHDQYARLYAADVVTAINALNSTAVWAWEITSLRTPHKPPTPAEAKQLADLSRAGKRLMGFCRTNLFKRLESGGQAFQQSDRAPYSAQFRLSARHREGAAASDRHARCWAA